MRREGGKVCGEVGGMGQTLSGYTQTTSNFHQRAMQRCPGIKMNIQMETGTL